ncbi:MAG: hypothetical protein MI810_03125 [Flavobacteriales bacterium]|nr:hypothetical protein [Flavobacteriales bacterium]
MTEKLLRAKHWQLFTIVIGLPFLINFIYAFYVISQLIGRGATNPFGEFMFISPLISVFPHLFFTAWEYAVIKGLRSRLGADVKVPFTSVKIFIVLGGILFPILSLAFGYISMQNSLHEPNYINPLPWLIIMAPLYILAAFSTIYAYVYIAKVIRCAETGKNEKFQIYGGDFALIWFWFIGIWFLQPRITKVLNKPISLGEGADITLDEGEIV